MAEQSGEQAREPRKKVSFEVDESTFASLRGIAHTEHRTVSAQLRVIVEDFVLEAQEPGS